MTRLSIALAVAGLAIVAAAAPAAAQDFSKPQFANPQYPNPQPSDPQFASAPVTTGSVGSPNYNNFNEGSEQKVSTYRKIASEAALLRYRLALKLTAAQEKYWPAAAAALRALSRQNELNEDVVKRFAPAVRPLIASLNDQQRQIAMGLAAQAGLSQYAALF
jgi:hypothetical protein